MTPSFPTRSASDLAIRVVFAEAEEELVLRAAIQFRDGGYGIPVLVGRNDVYDRLAALGIADPHSFEVHNSVNSPLVPKMVEFLYQRLQRRGYLRRDCERMVNRDRNIFGALLLQDRKSTRLNSSH